MKIINEGELFEALPRDLALAFKNAESTNDDNVAGYGNINKKTVPPNIDFDKSTYTEISKEEALSSNLYDLRIIFDGQLVVFDKSGVGQIYSAYDINNKDDLYLNKSSTEYLPAKYIIDNADKIYLANEIELKPKDNISAMSKYIDKYEVFPGSNVSKADLITKHRIASDQRGLDRVVNAYNAETEPYSKVRLSTDVVRKQTMLDNSKKTYEKQKYDRQNFNVARRYAAANRYLMTPLGKLKSLKLDIQLITNELGDVIEHIDNIESGEPYHSRVGSNIRELETINKELKSYSEMLEFAISKGEADDVVLNRLSDKVKRLRLKFEELKEWTPVYADEDAAEIKELRDKLSQLEVDRAQVQNDIDLLMKHPYNEALEPEYLTNSAKTVYDKIVDFGKEDELNSLIEELYGELTEDQLSDILEGDPHYIYQQLGMEETDED